MGRYNFPTVNSEYVFLPLDILSMSADQFSACSATPFTSKSKILVVPNPLSSTTT